MLLSDQKGEGGGEHGDVHSAPSPLPSETACGWGAPITRGGLEVISGCAAD